MYPFQKNADNLRKMTFDNPYKASFQPIDDIIDINSIQNKILTMTIDQQKECYEFIKKEIGNDIDIVKVDSNLATIINILAKENLEEGIESPEINPFEIDNKI